MKIAALVSGGVDSSVVVHLLKEQGFTPDIFYIHIAPDSDDGFFSCPAEEDVEIVTWLAHKYGCHMEQIDLSKEYEESVIRYTVDSARRGLTPNPDVMCNRTIKFGAFVDRCGSNYDRIATGHYATTDTYADHVFIATAKDPVKDQTDFLSQLDYSQIRQLMFPIGNLMKQQVRDIANAASLPSATRKDSQGICFLGKVNYNDFLRRYLGEREGMIVEQETGKILGTHKGYWFHTIGQRKGLCLGGGPWFVVKKDIEENVIYVSHGYDTAAQYGNHIEINGFRHLSTNIWGDDRMIDVKFKIRHTPEFHQGQLHLLPGDAATIDSDDPIQGIAAGQYATIYDNDAHLMVASGMIV
ncbi:MAG: tRNA 2-thiouridine(34) synthase MnmA [Bacteroidales bacterium]|nr:tRNA 2-thiouridine(34) synthase MnmA [Bacteroidales bacterium]